MRKFIKADSGKFGSENQVKFFYKGKFLGSCDSDYIECPELLNLMESDKEVATLILNYMNSLGDPVFPVSEEDWGTPETNVDNVDITDLYNTFMQELDYEYRDSETMGFGFYVGGDYLLPDFEIFDGPTVDDVESSTKIKASRYDNVPGYRAPEGGYLYIFKHGIGPGTMPKDVEIIETKDLPNYYTAVWLSDFLTTDELKKYDIPDETRINELLSRIGYCQKNGDVVPCDDVEACGDIKASTRYMANMVSASDDGADESEWYDWWNDVDGYLMGWDKEFKQLIYDFRKKNGWPKDFKDPLCDKLADAVYEYVRTHLDELDIDPSENNDSDYREFADERMLDWLLEEPAAYDFWADYKG